MNQLRAQFTIEVHTNEEAQALSHLLRSIRNRIEWSLTDFADDANFSITTNVFDIQAEAAAEDHDHDERRSAETDEEASRVRY